MTAAGTDAEAGWLDVLFEEAPFGVAWFDPDLRYRRVNARLARMNGLEPEEHVGLSIGDVVLDADPALLATVGQALARREAVSTEAEGETRAQPGVKRRWLVSLHPVAQEGELAGVVGVILEVSGKAEREDELGRLIELERAARTRAEAAERRAEFLSEATSSLDASLDLATTLRTLSRIVVPSLADICLVDMLEGRDERVRRLAVAHADPTVESEIWELTRRWPSSPDSGQGIREVMRSGEPRFFPEVTEPVLEAAFPEVEHRDRVRQLDLRSAVVVPLRARGRTLGAMTFVQAGSGRSFSPADIALAEELSRRAGLAVDNARLYTEANRADRTQRFLAEATQLLAASLDWETTVTTVARLATSGIADCCTVDVADDLGEIRPAAASHVDPGKLALLEETRRLYPTRVAASLYVNEAQRRAAAVLTPQVGEAEYRELAEDEEHLRRLRELGVRSGLVVPMIARGRVIGLLGLGITESDRRFEAEDARVAEELALRAAVAADNARLYSDRSRVARTLQRSLMPAELPSLPGIEAAVRFRSAGDGQEVGGDFYDVFAAADDAWVAVVGDVCGKGAEAAALTALSRHTVRAAARYEAGPVGVLAALNGAILEQSPELLFTTAALLRIEPGRGEVRVRAALGGHLPPLVVRLSGEIEQLCAPGTLLGVFPSPELQEVETVLRPGDAVVLYTDGVTEAGAPHAALGEDALAEILRGQAGRPAADIVHVVEERAAAADPGLPRDDMAVLALRYSG